MDFDRISGIEPQFPRFLHRSEVVLPQCFVENNRDAVGKIETADFRQHRNPKAGIDMVVKNRFGNPGTFFTENQMERGRVGGFGV